MHLRHMKSIHSQPHGLIVDSDGWKSAISSQTQKVKSFFNVKCISSAIMINHVWLKSGTFGHLLQLPIGYILLKPSHQSHWILSHENTMSFHHQRTDSHPQLQWLEIHVVFEGQKGKGAWTTSSFQPTAGKTQKKRDPKSNLSLL